uniref:Anti-proliferative protein domain-containing protein n=1 Tax=Apteryx owenii TaxID=8824 RepID=A0A8B9QDW1_APTOW
RSRRACGAPAGPAGLAPSSVALVGPAPEQSGPSRAVALASAAAEVAAGGFAPSLLGHGQPRCLAGFLLKINDATGEQNNQKEHYRHHWFPLRPSRGSGYRCIRINHKMDPLVGRAAGMIGLSHERLFQLLPSELTLWVDPFEVSYRIGEDGSICVLYEGPRPAASTPKALEHRSGCKEWRPGRSSPSKNYTMMAVSS